MRCTNCGKEIPRPKVNRRGVVVCPFCKKDTPAEMKEPASIGRIMSGIAACLVLIMVFEMLLHPIGGTKGSGLLPAETQDPEGILQDTDESEGGWSPWVDVLPPEVTDADYVVEERTCYRTRQLEIVSSTDADGMPGWELYNVAAEGSDFGEWSEWSDTPVTASSSREVETQLLYRYCDKETTTSTSSSLSGWTLEDTTFTYGDWQGWSSWSASAVSASNTRKVETGTQYRTRSATTTVRYSDWSAWSDWSHEQQAVGTTKKEETRKLWAYYYFKCPSCGAHMHGWNIPCYTWAGGCGKATIPQNSRVELYSPTSWNDAGLKTFHSTGKYYTILNGERVFKWSEGGSKTQYRYATRQLEAVSDYGEWSGWSSTPATKSEGLDVQTRTIYRYADRAQSATYHYSRWGAWFAWQPDEIKGSSNRKVETATFYRSRDKVDETTYFFHRWSPWSEYSTEQAYKTDTCDVETKTQYRYRLK